MAGRVNWMATCRKTYRAFLFDAYGTLFDVHSVVVRAGTGIAGDLEGLSRLWRQKQLEFTWLRALMDRYEDFWQITEAALRTALAQLHMEASEPQVRQLLDAYLAPAVFPDARVALDALGDFPRAILSNGTPEMLEAAVRNNGLESYFSSVISVDQVKTYKPSPRVYQLGPDLLHLARPGHSLRVIQCMGCRGRQGLRVQRLLVQPIRAVRWITWDSRPTSSCPASTRSRSLTDAVPNLSVRLSSLAETPVMTSY